MKSLSFICSENFSSRLAVNLRKAFTFNYYLLLLVSCAIHSTTFDIFVNYLAYMAHNDESMKACVNYLL